MQERFRKENEIAGFMTTAVSPLKLVRHLQKEWKRSGLWKENLRDKGEARRMTS